MRLHRFRPIGGQNSKRVHKRLLLLKLYKRNDLTRSKVNAGVINWCKHTTLLLSISPDFACRCCSVSQFAHFLPSLSRCYERGHTPFPHSTLPQRAVLLRGICNRQRRRRLRVIIVRFKCQRSYTFSRYLCRYASPRRRFTTCVSLWAPNAALRNTYVHTYHRSPPPPYYKERLSRCDITFYIPRDTLDTSVLFFSCFFRRLSLRFFVILFLRLSLPPISLLSSAPCRGVSVRLHIR